MTTETPVMKGSSDRQLTARILDDDEVEKLEALAKKDHEDEQELDDDTEENDDE